jgi:microcompartment protein CcmL/EutN
MIDLTSIAREAVQSCPYGQLDSEVESALSSSTRLAEAIDEALREHVIARIEEIVEDHVTSMVEDRLNELDLDEFISEVIDSLD